MEVTEVKVFPVNEDKLKAFATITLDGCFVVRDLKIIHGSAGLFVAMPSKKRRDGTFKDTAHPLNNESRAMIEEKVLGVYYEEAKKLGYKVDIPARPTALSGGIVDDSNEEGRGGEGSVPQA